MGGRGSSSSAKASGSGSAASTEQKTIKVGDKFDLDSIKYSFKQNMFSIEEGRAIRQGSTGEAFVTAETEKAIKVSVPTDFGKIDKWVPKSVLKTEKDLLADKKRQKENFQKLDNFRGFLKDNGSKLRHIDNSSKSSLVHRLKKTREGKELLSKAVKGGFLDAKDI